MTLCFSVLFLALTANANERVFLLQLGSYESEAEANARWLNLQDSYPSLLDGLSVRLLDVTLPPDNFTVYRTQAGALTSREDAQIICERLNAKGDECYVVETAMFSPTEMPSVAEPISQPLPQAQSAIAAAPKPTLAPSVEPLPTMGNGLESEMQQMEQSLAAVQPAPVAAQPADTATYDYDADPRPSFWQLINPFSEDEPQPELVEAMPPLAADTAPAIPTPNPQPVIAPAPIAAAPAALPALLPPPPMPEMGVNTIPQQSDMPPASAQVAPQPQPVAPMAPVPMAVGASANAAPAENLPFQVKRDGELISAPSNFVPAGDEVQVAEAVQVPVSGMQRISPQPYSAQQLKRLGMPSQTVRQKNLWAEVKFFESQQEALAFWDEFRRINPDFPAARVRITNPYMTARSSRPRISLRVGPFEHTNLVGAICAQVRGVNSQCLTVRDLGGSTGARFDRQPGQLMQRAQRYQKPNMGRQMYWVQLGSYPNPGAAYTAWESLRALHSPMLNDYNADVAAPSQGSAMRATYRLRTGPYAMRPSADALCQQLKLQGTRCATVFAN